MELVVMVKPEAYNISQRVLYEFDKVAKRNEDFYTTLTSNLFETIYGHLKNHPNKFYNAFKTDVLGKRVIISIYEGEVDNLFSVKESLREELKKDITQLKNSGNYKRNGVHSSDSKRSAKREVKAIRLYL